MIGEVGNFWPTNETSLKVLRASARASVETGAAILIHPGFHPDSPPHILNTLVEAGTDPKRIIMGHLDVFAVGRDWLRDLAKSGCYMEYDLFGSESSHYPLPGSHMPNDVQRLEKLQLLVESGFGKKALVAQDICTKHRLVRYGGHGYQHILQNIVPRMKQGGFSSAEVGDIITNNPAAILTFE